MCATRSAYIFRLRSVGNKIFGCGGTDSFDSKFDRSAVPEFQVLLGVKNTSKGKRYPMFPPILYPDGKSMDPKQLFLNPALTKVNIRFNRGFLRPTNPFIDSQGRSIWDLLARGQAGAWPQTHRSKMGIASHHPRGNRTCCDVG